MECCKFLEENVHIAEVNTPTGVRETEISKISLTTKLKPLDMKWLGFDCRVNTLQHDNVYSCFSFRPATERIILVFFLRFIFFKSVTY